MDSFDYRQRAAAELISWISATATERSAAAGSHLIQEGDQAEALLFLLDGQLEAITSDAEQRDVTLGSLAAGAVIGEMSWLEQRPAVADIVSRSTCQLLELPFSSIQQLERSNPHLAAQLHRLLAQKLALQIQQQNIRLAGEAQNPVEPLRKVLTCSPICSSATCTGWPASAAIRRWPPERGYCARAKPSAAFTWSSVVMERSSWSWTARPGPSARRAGVS